MNNLTAVKGLEMPTGDKRCKLCVKHVSPAECTCCTCERCENNYCSCYEEVRCCVVTLTHCEGLESDKADDCPMFELESTVMDDDDYCNGVLAYMYAEVKP